jgi:hypothetical protein
MPSCEEVRDELSSDIDGQGSLLRCMMLRAHLAMCERRRRAERALRDTVDLLHALEDEPVEEQS